MGALIRTNQSLRFVNVLHDFLTVAAINCIFLRSINVSIIIIAFILFLDNWTIIVDKLGYPLLFDIMMIHIRPDHTELPLS
ncbi:MAG: hypothetical protein [Cressdnaviricota sp.]|nr:MAG: hypothetical protein [Cressdnaviricota sp.]